MVSNISDNSYHADVGWNAHFSLICMVSISWLALIKGGGALWLTPTPYCVLTSPAQDGSTGVVVYFVFVKIRQPTTLNGVIKVLFVLSAKRMITQQRPANTSWRAHTQQSVTHKRTQNILKSFSAPVTTSCHKHNVHNVHNASKDLQWDVWHFLDYLHLLSPPLCEHRFSLSVSHTHAHTHTGTDTNSLVEHIWGHFVRVKLSLLGST